MRSLLPVKYDFMFQFRHGFYYAYIVVTLLYILIVRFIPELYQSMVIILLLFSDPCIMGFFFVGTIIILERDQNIHQSLFVTPLTITKYLLSKSLVFAGLTLITGYVIVIFGIGMVNLLPLTISLFLSSIFFTLLGISASVRAKNLNRFLIVSPGYLLLFFAPLMEYLNFFKLPLTYGIPSKATLVLLEGTFRPLSMGEWFYGVGFLLLSISLAYLWAVKSYKDYIISGKGGI